MNRKDAKTQRKSGEASVFILALCLLLIFASRIFRLDVDITEVRVDEIWSVWQTLGTPEQIIRWTPYDWPPGYYLTLGLWRGLVGLHPVALRLLSVLLLMLGCTLIYRVLAHMHSRRAALIGMLAYAALGYQIFLSTELRGYALLLMLLPAGLLFTVCYFDHPVWRRALPLGITLAAMFYVSLTSVGAFAFLGFYTLVVYTRRVWRWWLPGVIALGLALPELANKAGLVSSRGQALTTLSLPWIGDALVNLYRDYMGDGALLWAGLLILATVLAFWRWRESTRPKLAIFLWCLMPVLLYLLNQRLGFFNPRYAWWVMIALALWAGIGLAYLPLMGQRIAVFAFAGLMFFPLPLQQYQIWGPPLGKSFAWLREKAQPGDVILLDPACEVCAAREQFDYFTRVYFPDGLRYVSQPQGYRRVWLVRDDTPDEAMTVAVSAGRIAGEWYGPAELQFQLWEAPPHTVGIPFENGMRFHGFDIMDETGPLVWHEGETIRLRLWWSADATPSLDYSVGVYVLDAQGVPLVQDDSAPRVITGAGETSRWETGHYYVEERTLVLPYPMGAGYFSLEMVVYFWADNTRITAPGVNEQGFLPLTSIQVMAW